MNSINDIFSALVNFFTLFTVHFIQEYLSKKNQYSENASDFKEEIEMKI